MSFDPEQLEPIWRTPKSLSALGYRDYALFWIASVVSNAGSMMYLAAIGWVVQVETGSPFKVTLVATLGMVPLLIMSPIGGSLADRMSRRRLLLISVVLSTLVAAALSITYAAGWASFGVLLVFALVGGCVASLGAPVQQAIIPELVPSESLRNGVVLNGMQFNVARALGPLLAGLIIAQWGAATAFWVNTMSFGAMIGALLLMRPRPAPSDGEHQGFVASFVQGARYARSQRGLMVAMTLGSLVGFALAPVQWLVPVIATDLFNADASQFGLLAGAFGLGSVAGAIVLLNVDNRVSNRQLISMGLPGLAIGLAALAISPVLALGVLAMMFAGLSFMAVMATLMTSLQALCADAYRGRVMSLWMMVFGVTLPLGTLIQGSFAEVVSIRVVLMADAVIVGIGFTYVLWKGLLRFLDMNREFSTSVPEESTPIIDLSNG
jgi:MFS family permease